MAQTHVSMNEIQNLYPSGPLYKGKGQPTGAAFPNFALGMSHQCTQDVDYSPATFFMKNRYQSGHIHLSKIVICKTKLHALRKIIGKG